MRVGVRRTDGQGDHGYMGGECLSFRQKKKLNVPGKYECSLERIETDQFSGFTTETVKLWRSDQEAKIKLILV